MVRFFVESFAEVGKMEGGGLEGEWSGESGVFERCE